MEWVFEINAYHWFALGLILFAAEALGAAGFMLGAAGAAIALGILTLAIPGLETAAQIGLYAVTAMVATILYLKVFRTEQDDQEDNLNHRAASLVGHEFDLSEEIPSGASRVQIGDTLWRVESEASLASGTRVKVIGADAMSLRVSSAN